jgi:hypothetical protein
MTLSVSWRLAVASAAFALLCMASLAPAQEVLATNFPAFTTFQVNNWTVSPAVQNQTVMGFLAYADPNSIVGSNIPVVWYQREADGSWTTWGWQDYDVTDAVLLARAYLADDTIFNDDPILSVQAQGVASGHLPKEVVNGLFIDDPLQEVMQTCSTPVEFMTALVDAGWSAAADLSPLAVSQAVTCGENLLENPIQAMMTEMAFKTEMTLYGVSTLNLDCFRIPCAGCQRIYDGKTPAPGSAWVFHSRILQANNSYLCFYDRDARQYWRETGLSYLFCNTCTGTGYISTTMHAQTISPVGDPDCHPPAN